MFCLVFKKYDNRKDYKPQTGARHRKSDDFEHAYFIRAYYLAVRDIRINGCPGSFFFDRRNFFRFYKFGLNFCARRKVR